MNKVKAAWKTFLDWCRALKNDLLNYESRFVCYFIAKIYKLARLGDGRIRLLLP